MSAVFMDHSEAVRVAVSRIDFGPSPDDAEADAHINGCPDCKAVVESITADQQWLSEMNWEPDSGVDYDEDDDPEDPDVDEDGDAFDDFSFGGEDAASDDDGDQGSGLPEDDPLPKLEADDEDQDEEDDSDPGDDDQPEDDEDADPDEGADDDDSTDSVASSDATDDDEAESEDDSEDGDDAASSDVDDEEMEDIEADAKAEADDMTDEELGELDDEPQPDDGDIASCAADAVENEAKDAGADPLSNDAAERAVRNQEGIVATDYGKVAVSKSTRGLTRAGRGMKPTPSNVAAAAIRNAVLKSRGGHTGVDRYQSRGRLDNQGLYRMSMQDTRLFRRVKAPSPTKLLVWIMVDCSGSMAGRDVADAASVARALADASSGTPSMRLQVWAWSDPFVYDQVRYAGAVAGVCKVWESGQPTSQIDAITELPMGGTPDAAVLDWAWRGIKREARGDEQPVIIMASDGQGDYRLHEVVELARRHKVGVRSVAIGRGMREPQQLQAYGRDKYIPWLGSIVNTARPLATMLTGLVNGGAP